MCGEPKMGQSGQTFRLMIHGEAAGDHAAEGKADDRSLAEAEVIEEAAELVR